MSLLGKPFLTWRGIPSKFATSATVRTASGSSPPAKITPPVSGARPRRPRPFTRVQRGWAADRHGGARWRSEPLLLPPRRDDDAAAGARPRAGAAPLDRAGTRALC